MANDTQAPFLPQDSAPKPSERRSQNTRLSFHAVFLQCRSAKVFRPPNQELHQRTFSARVSALEAAPLGIRVNAVAPGPTETAMLDRLTGTPDKKAAFYAAIPLKRGAKPEEIADAILFLASDKASFITGQIIRVNGGKTAT